MWMIKSSDTSLPESSADCWAVGVNVWIAAIEKPMRLVKKREIPLSKASSKRETA